MRLRLVAFPNLFPGFQIQASLWKRHFDARCSITLPPADQPDRGFKLHIGYLFPKLPNNELWVLSNTEECMPAIASLDDLKAAQQDFLQAKDLEELKAAFRKSRRIGWKNVCKLWLQERTPEQLKGEGS
jgi:hypothetical protein